jgi:pentatricopeptide repeat protein
VNKVDRCPLQGGELKKEEANVLFELMIQRGQDPDTFTYTTLMNGFCLAGRLDDAKELSDSMPPQSP